MKFFIIRRFHARSRVTHTMEWSDFLLCLNRNDCKNAVKTSSESTRLPKSSPNTTLNYHNHSGTTVTDNFYYYNGISQAPVMCPMEPPGLGLLNPNQLITLYSIENLYNVLQPGGIYNELDCTPRQTVAIIVPYSEDKNLLLEFLYLLHPTLIEQQLEYQIFVIQQGKSQYVNRGRLLNAGFTEAQKLKKNGGWRCVVFHHLDVVPVDTRNLYRCDHAPVQLVSTLINNKSYEYSFGGAIAIKPKDFLKVNGFSNLYVDYAEVYEDLHVRLCYANISIITRDNNIAKYLRLSPALAKDFNNKTRLQTISTNSPLHLLDGLSTLTYNLKKVEMKPLYTSIEVDFEKADSNYQTVRSNPWDRLLNQVANSDSIHTNPKTKKGTLKP
ncbi:hypothetical protein ACJJTC_002497 [Scirpophaga incertulas]